MKANRKMIAMFTLLVIVALAISLVACNKVEELLYGGPENVAYDGQYIVWSNVDGAKHYTVSINGGEAVRANSTTYAYSSTDSFEVTVSAVFDDFVKSTSITFKPLAKIQNLIVSDNGEVSWNAVSGASAYSVSVNGSVQTITDTRISVAEGSNKVKVKPIVSGDSTYFSSYSDEVNVYVYGAPTNIKYDGTSLTWSGNSASYQVTINGNSQEVKGNTFSYSSDNKDFTAEVKALGNHTSTYDSKSVSEDFRYLDAVTEIQVADGALKWNAIPGAEGYKIKIDGIVQKASVTVAQYDNLSSGKSQDIAVMPYNNSGNYFSSWSAEKTVYILDTPIVDWNNSLALDGKENNNYTWNIVNAAGGYTVRLIKDGGTPVIETYGNSISAFGYAYKDVGKYTIEVKANADSHSANYYDSKYSSPITVERLAAPMATSENFITSDKDKLASGFTVNFLPVSGASGYQLYKDGNELDGKYTTGSAITDSNVVDSTNIQQQNYNYFICSMGGMKTVNGAKYVTLPCLTKDALSFEITVQATPQNLLMVGFKLSWNHVIGNNGYTVAHSGTTVTANAENIDLSTLKAGTYSVTVCARGNGSNVLASNYSAPANIERLSYPTNIRMNSKSDGTLEWNTDNPQANVKSYTVFLGGSASETGKIDGSSFTNMYQHISTAGTTLSIVANNNDYNDDETLYYMSSEASPTQRFIRLATPIFPEGAIAGGTELVWNAPANINTSKYPPSYEVYKTPTDKVDENFYNATKYNIESLSAGQHTFYVKAIGNGTEYVDSALSEVITFEKIATPSIRIEDGKYVWDAVSYASSYYLEIDGTKVNDAFQVSGQTYSYKPRFTSEGTHIVKLKAVGDRKSSVDSAFDVHNQTVKVLSRPEISYRYSAESGIIVTVTKLSEHCSGYQYEIGSVSSQSTETTYSQFVQSASSYSIRVKALGGSFDAEGTYYTDSLYVGGSASDTITILAAPSESSFKMTGSGIISWGSIGSALGYYYQISFDGGEYSDVTQTGESRYIVGNNYNQYSKISIKVCARGDGNKMITSSWTEWTWTNSNPVG